MKQCSHGIPVEQRCNDCVSAGLAVEKMRNHDSAQLEQLLEDNRQLREQLSQERRERNNLARAEAEKMLNNGTHSSALSDFRRMLKELAIARPLVLYGEPWIDQINEVLNKHKGV